MSEHLYSSTLWFACGRYRHCWHDTSHYVKHRWLRRDFTTNSSTAIWLSIRLWTPGRGAVFPFHCRAESTRRNLVKRRVGPLSYITRPNKAQPPDIMGPKFMNEKNHVSYVWAASTAHSRSSERISERKQGINSRKAIYARSFNLKSLMTKQLSIDATASKRIA